MFHPPGRTARPVPRLRHSDDPQHGNHAQPSVKPAAGLASDWEEPGERAWDVIQAHDYLRSLPYVEAERIVLAGLSMGGEVATLVAALDPRFAVTIAAGYSPDLGVMALHGNHACWQWLAADMREYVDVADLHALIAPRALMVQTSKQDRTFSAAAAPYAADKQVARRTRAAYHDAPGQFIHYLHDPRLYAHEFCVGGVYPDNPNLVVGIEVPRRAAPATEPQGDPGWQTDGEVWVPPLGTTLRRHCLTTWMPGWAPAHRRCPHDRPDRVPARRLNCRGLCTGRRGPVGGPGGSAPAPRERPQQPPLIGKCATWLGTERLAVIHFNCGLHDLKRAHATGVLGALDEYAANLRLLVPLLQARAEAVIWARTTPVSDGQHAPTKPFDRFNHDVDAYNAAADAVMADLRIPSHDLHGAIGQAGRDRCLAADGVHMTEAGYAALARQVAGAVTRLLNRPGHGPAVRRPA